VLEVFASQGSPCARSCVIRRNPAGICGSIQPPIPVDPATGSGRIALGRNNGAATQQGHKGNSLTASLRNKADLWSQHQPMASHDPKGTFTVKESRLWSE